MQALKSKRGEMQDFLMRFCPGLREEGLLDNLNSLVIKKEYSAGATIIRQNEINDSLFILYKGKCRILISIQSESCAKTFPEEIREKFNNVTLDHLHKGAIFGEHSAVNGVVNPYAVEVSSKSATVLKIRKKCLK